MLALPTGGYSSSGRRMYIDSDAPLHSIPGWKTALVIGELAITETMFDSIKSIIEESFKKMEKD